MYPGQWDEAIRVATSNSHDSIDILRENYYNWLIETYQEEVAGGIKESDGSYNEAISLYLKGISRHRYDYTLSIGLDFSERHFIICTKTLEYLWDLKANQIFVLTLRMNRGAAW